MPTVQYRQRITRGSRLLFAVGIGLLAVGIGLLSGIPASVSAQTEPTPFPLYALPDARLSTSTSSNILALEQDNRNLVVANMFNNSISVVQPVQGKLVAEIPVGQDPRSVVITSDGTRAVTANRGDGTLSVVNLTDQSVTTIALNGVHPYGLILGDD